MSEFAFKTEPYPHQLDLFNRFKDTLNFGLFWEMGTGKTKVTIDILSYKNIMSDINRVVTVAPNFVHAQWINEQFPVHCSVPYVGHAYSSATTKAYEKELMSFLLAAEQDKSNRMYVFAVHIDAFAYTKVLPYLSRFTRDRRVAWVVDEATRIKNSKAKSVSTLFTAANAAACKVFLTGTALTKNPKDIFNLMEFLHKNYFGCTEVAFAHRHAVMFKRKVKFMKNGYEREAKVDSVIDEKTWRIVRASMNKRAMRNKGTLDFDDYIALMAQYGIEMNNLKLIESSPTMVRFKNLDKLKQDVACCTDSLKKTDCLQLPDKVYNTTVLPLTTVQKQLIKQLSDYSVALYGDKELTLRNKMSLQMRALQICGGFFPHVKDLSEGVDQYAVTRIDGPNPKLNFLKESLEEVGDSPFIVWAVFRAELEMLYEELSKEYSVSFMHGGTPKNSRDEVVADFKSGKIQGLISNPRVGGYGLNFQHCSLQYWYSRDYFTEARAQAEDRSHRIGVVKAPVYVDIILDAEFERNVLRNNKEGISMNDYFMSTDVKGLFTI